MQMVQSQLGTAVFLKLQLVIKPGMHHPDPFAGDDKVLYTITNANKDQYKDLLTPGIIKMFETYPDTYKMDVYQTRRTASYPQSVYDATNEKCDRSYPEFKVVMVLKVLLLAFHSQFQPTGY